MVSIEVVADYPYKSLDESCIMEEVSLKILESTVVMADHVKICLAPDGHKVVWHSKKHSV